MFKLISFRIIILIFIVTSFIIPASAFAHWADDIFQDFKSQNYISIEKTQLNDNVSKGEVSSIINRYYAYEDTFKSFDKSLEIAKEKGYFQNAKASDYIPREEFVIAICKLIGEDDVSELIESQSEFIDDNEVSNWAKPYVLKLNDLNIIKGYPNGDFKPHNLLTYAELITALSRIRGQGGGDFQLIEENIDKVTLKVIQYSDGEIRTKNIDELLQLNLGNKVEIAVMLPDDVDENKIQYIVLNENVAKFDKKYNVLTAKSKGKTKMQVMYQDKVQQEFDIVVSK